MIFYYEDRDCVYHDFDSLTEAVQCGLSDPEASKDIEAMVKAWLYSWDEHDLIDSIVCERFKDVSFADMAEDCVRSEYECSDLCEGKVGPFGWYEKE